MKAGDGSAEAKRRAGHAAADAVEDGTVVGLGTGSTAAYAIEAIGRAVENGLDVRGVATSAESVQLARECGIPLTTLAAVDGIDLAIDGADQVADGDLIKGGGAAHTREKLIDAAADRFLVVVDDSKLADRLDWPVPVAVLQGAESVVAERLRELGGDPTLREAERKDGPVVTDDGHLVLDCDFGPIDDPEALATDLSAIPGVVEHGLFVDLADEIYVGSADGVDVLQ
ncbi:ribose-5-phosphate isomerase A [Halovivax asiaticus JCM 14624]|uniref:Ribose-5-phosphate isomerase A n=1 Tax=Halovivax asiaticus JCM 14624 TaxID=1227490 RepID=M0BL33_9EURY|nr:ribose-5-phosphate isomerase RpiA [Halovivax asiaticus]ELZ10998.1 ribose-5-phosphate isomerase A [Halovivax asiaticus JCM 14624]